jgi:protein-glutamine gamma-glutamyltransferase
MTSALATLGFLSLLTSGSLAMPTVVLMVLGLVATYFLPDRYQSSAWQRHLGMYGSLGLLTLEAVRLALGQDVLIVAVEFAGGLQIIRLATRRGAAHDQQVILLALLHLVAGTILGGGLAFGACFLGFLVIAPGALVLSHLRREVEGNYRQGARDRTGLPVDVPRILRSRRVVSRRFLVTTCALSIPIFLFTGLLFVMFPRVGLSFMLMRGRQQERMIGFSDRVDLGKVGTLRSDTTLALRVHLPHLRENPPRRIPLYLRGTAFDSYDAGSWRRDRTQGPADQEQSTVRIRTQHRDTNELMTIDLEPIKPPVVFMPIEATSFQLLGPTTAEGQSFPKITRGRESDFEYVTNQERGLKYRVYGRPPRTPTYDHQSATDLDRYLTLPADLPPRVHQLAAQWAAGSTTPRVIARQVELQLRNGYRYDLNSSSGNAPNPLDHFLFESRSGHCEYYSTSMAILLRTLGIPTRNVTGFIGGTLNRFGNFYAVRQGDAHSWVEVWLEGEGWTRFDPTPSADPQVAEQNRTLSTLLRDLLDAAAERWDRNVVGYDLGQQLKLLSKVRERLQDDRAPSSFKPKTVATTAAILVLVGAAGWVVWRVVNNRRRSLTTPRPTPEQRRVHRVVEAYKRVDELLAQRGVPRSASVPPLTHARALAALGHPLGELTLELTELYVAVRFGDHPFDRDEEQRFQQLLRELRDVAVQRAA